MYGGLERERGKERDSKRGIEETAGLEEPVNCRDERSPALGLIRPDLPECSRRPSERTNERVSEPETQPARFRGFRSREPAWHRNSVSLRSRRGNPGGWEQQEVGQVFKGRLDYWPAELVDPLTQNWTEQAEDIYGLALKESEGPGSLMMTTEKKYYFNGRGLHKLKCLYCTCCQLAEH